MAGANKSGTQTKAAKAAQDEGGDGGQQRSSIAFPYANLDESIGVAKAINSNVGGGTCTDHQLAPWLRMSQKSSGYRMRIYAARMFGLIEAPGTGLHALTDLGKKAVDENQERAARAEAFLRVPLFRKVFEDHQGHALPPTAALEREIELLGVATKTKERARQMLERCAEQAGYFEQGKGRLVAPGVKVGEKPKKDEHKGGGGGGGGDGEHHLLIQGLILQLPKADADTWSLDKRMSWLKTAVTIFDNLYGEADAIKIERIDAKATK